VAEIECWSTESTRFGSEIAKDQVRVPMQAPSNDSLSLLRFSMAASGVCAGGLEALSGALAGPNPPSTSTALQSRARRSSWHGPGREERQQSGGAPLKTSFVGPNLPTPDRGTRSRRTSTGEVLPTGGARGRRMSTGGVRAEASREAVVAPQLDAERLVPNGYVGGREMEDGAQGILDGMDEQLPVR
jgi:hypothetical protein